jgi:hypothetical protein
MKNKPIRFKELQKALKPLKFEDVWYLPTYKTMGNKPAFNPSCAETRKFIKKIENEQGEKIDEKKNS